MHWYILSFPWILPLVALGDDKVIPLSDWNQCGPNALYVCARLAGIEVTRDRLIELCEVDSDGGCSVADLVRAARAVGFRNACAVQTSVTGLSNMRVPAIIHDNLQTPQHFLAVIGQRDGEFLVLNPPSGHYWLNKEKAAQEWDGVAVLLSITPIVGLEEGHAPRVDQTAALVAGIVAGSALAFLRTSLTRLLARHRANSVPQIG